ncbi:hypothetical protein N8I77_011896 [Diaporthe amygdali]|uniref:Uncharacterized protein n=1 Tax=Phomopsis amygdali TaxID=1214568 RepID=A0AAD9VZD1_PHOAM|nr:hypothetical protein N8I77_011896 [Diaporthe amygdali]
MSHLSILKSATLSGRRDLVDIALRHLHTPPDQTVDLSMVDDTILREYEQIAQANVEPSERFESRSGRDLPSGMSTRSGGSASSKASQTSFDPRDIFDQVLNSMIERLDIVMPAIRGTRFNRLVGKDRSLRLSLVTYLQSYRDKKLRSHFGMSDGPRRFNLNGFSDEYLRCRVQDKLEGWGDRLTMMTERMWNAPILDHDVAPEAPTVNAMEVD